MLDDYNFFFYSKTIEETKIDLKISKTQVKTEKIAVMYILLPLVMFAVQR